MKRVLWCFLVAAMLLPAGAAPAGESDVTLGRLSRSVHFDHLRLDFWMRNRGRSHRCFVILPIPVDPDADRDELNEIDIEEFIQAKQRDWFWLSPVRHDTETSDNAIPNRWHTWYFGYLLDAGSVIAGVEIGHKWGNPAGRRLYTNFYYAVTDRFNLKPRTNLLAQGIGGLAAYNWACDHPDKVRSIGGIYPVTQIRLDSFFARVYDLAGNQDPEENMQALRENFKDHNPQDRLEPLAEAGARIAHVHGSEDRNVPPSIHTIPLVLRYRELGGDADAIIVRGKRHGPSDMIFESRRFLRFLLEQVGEPELLEPDEPDEPDDAEDDAEDDTGDDTKQGSDEEDE